MSYYTTLLFVVESTPCKRGLKSVLLSCLLLWIPLWSDILLPPKKTYQIGVCIMANSCCDAHVQSLIDSARRFFCPHHRVTFFLFCQHSLIAEAPDLIKIHQPTLGWPYDFLKRFQVYDEHKELFQDMEFIFAIDPGMVFVTDVEDEVLSDLIATQHASTITKKSCYQMPLLKKRKNCSTQIFYSGRFYGGRTQQFLELIKVLQQKVNADLAQNYIPRWHDESYLNWYFTNHKPTKILSPSYCYPEGWHLNCPKKIISVVKRHPTQKED